ncbi:hypothetical protein D9M71_213460 [compost metagenome]
MASVGHHSPSVDERQKGFDSLRPLQNSPSKPLFYGVFSFLGSGNTEEVSKSTTHKLRWIAPG